MARTTKGICGLATVAGDGIWSHTIKQLPVTVGYSDGNSDAVYAVFDTADWDVAELDLIYTDKGFARDIRAILVAHGISRELADSVGYSEQGMQGVNYVHFDCAVELVHELCRRGVPPFDIDDLQY